jgi:tRNA pseudouridine38-40 synthase
VAHFATKSQMTDEKIVQATNYFLPPDIVVLSAKTVKPSFHAQYSAKGKTYQYVIWNSRVRPSYDVAPYALWKPTALDVAKMRLAAKVLVGKHDFSAFRDSGEDERNPVRTIRSLKITKVGSKIAITVIGDGFLRHMIRVIAGTLVEVGRGRFTPEQVRVILNSKDRKKAGPTIQAKGLTLIKVHY